LPGAPPRAPTATHALFSSTAEEVTQIVGSSGGTHHARGDGHHHHFHRAFGSAHQHFPVPQQPGAPYAYPAYPGSGSQGPTPPALGGPGFPAHAFGALGPAGARGGLAEAPRTQGGGSRDLSSQKLEQKLKRKRGKEAKEERRADVAKDADDAGSDSIMTGQPGPSEGAPEVSAREKGSSGSRGATGAFGGSVVPKKSRSGRARGKKEDRPKKDQSAADILVSIANA
jgi:hypothetical protein